MPRSHLSRTSSRPGSGLAAERVRPDRLAAHGTPRVASDAGHRRGERRSHRSRTHDRSGTRTSRTALPRPSRTKGRSRTTLDATFIRSAELPVQRSDREQDISSLLRTVTACRSAITEPIDFVPDDAASDGTRGTDPPSPDPLRSERRPVSRVVAPRSHDGGRVVVGPRLPSPLLPRFPPRGFARVAPGVTRGFVTRPFAASSPRPANRPAFAGRRGWIDPASPFDARHIDRDDAPVSRSLVAFGA